MTNEITINQQLTPSIWQMIKEIAPAMQASRLFGTSNEESAMAIMLKGYELGFSFTASFEFIHVIDGKPGLSPRGMLALIQQSPNLQSMEIEDLTDDKGNPSSCLVTMIRITGFTYSTGYTMENAKAAKLIKPGSGWEKYPANMLRWRAIGYCADVVFPDIIGGMKRIDELGSEITEAGEVWEAEAVAKSQYVTTDNEGKETSINNEPDIPDYDTDLSELLTAFTTEAVVDANNGSMPVTPEQINRVAHILIGPEKDKTDDKPNS